MQVWVEVSENGRDFVRQTLQVEPTLRLTAVEALRHQWMLATHQSPKRKQVCVCVCLRFLSHYDSCTSMGPRD